MKSQADATDLSLSTVLIEIFTSTAYDWFGISYLDAPAEGFGPKTCERSCFNDALLQADISYRSGI
jgi:hypothetical protein